MATLTLGPRLGSPASTGFSVWAQTDGAASVALETKLTTDSTWTVQDTQAVDTAQENTVTLTASGLDAKTLYDYRLKLDGVVAITEQTMTMPSGGSGRFVVYSMADFHSHAGNPTDATQVTAWALADWEANYKGQNIPGVIAFTGDMVTPQGSTTKSAQITVWETILALHCGAGLAMSRLPIMYQHDDWDWGGNNSSKTLLPAYSSEVDPYQAAVDVMSIFWRDRPQPASPSYGYSVDICGVPFVFTDGRSLRENQNSITPQNDNYMDDSQTAYGAVQEAWAISEFAGYRSRALVFWYNGGTLTDNLDSTITKAGPAGRRDSIGIWWKASRNRIFDGAQLGKLRNNLVVISGDDHRNIFLDGQAGANTDVLNDTEFGIAEGRAPFKELKVSSNSSGSVFNSDTFGTGDTFRNESATLCLMRIDITTKGAGTWAAARFTWIDSADGSTVLDEEDPTISGDVYFQNGAWEYYDASTSGVQKYPPENSAEPKPLFGKAYVDDINGTMHTRERVSRDYHNRLRRTDDHDEEDRDELKARIRTRTEAPLEPIVR